MDIRTKKITYLIITSLFTLMMLATIGNSIFNSEFTKRFAEIGYPTYLIFPLMTSKGLGLVAIWSNKSHLLKEWAYAGFFFLFLLVILTEINAPNPDYFSPPIAMILLLISCFLWKKTENKITTSISAKK